MEVLQRYTCTARPWRILGSPAPHKVWRPSTKSTSGSRRLGTSNVFHLNWSTDAQAFWKGPPTERHGITDLIWLTFDFEFGEIWIWINFMSPMNIEAFDRTLAYLIRIRFGLTPVVRYVRLATVCFDEGFERLVNDGRPYPIQPRSFILMTRNWEMKIMTVS